MFQQTVSGRRTNRCFAFLGSLGIRATVLLQLPLGSTLGYTVHNRGSAIRPNPLTVILQTNQKQIQVLLRFVNSDDKL